MAKTNGRAEDYGVSSIKVLKGLEPVKQRPGMYTLTDNPLHIIQEVVDNATDEVLAGFGSRISVTLHADGGITVEDNGRGIPTGLHPEEKVPVVELVFTRLHAGGKFAKSDGSGPYSFAGGLHGVGVSVTNALSTTLDVTVWRDGEESTIGFADGDVVSPLKSRRSPRPKSQTGTRVTAHPDPKYFDSPAIPEGALIRLLRSKAVLLPGCEVVYKNEKTGREECWKYEGGLREYLLSEIAAEPLVAPFEAHGYVEDAGDGYAVGEGAAWVVIWTTEGGLERESYVNLIPTPQGGTHEAGLKDGLYQAMLAFMQAHGLQAKNVKILSEDVFSRANFVLSTKALDPQFQGQTKEKLTSRETMKLVSGFVRPQFEFWLNDHIEEGKKLAELIVSQAQARQRQSTKYEKKKSSSVAVLPGKLTDCESDDISMNELFIVEGDSAGGSAKSGRSRKTQAILPLRGKILNVEKAMWHKAFESDEVNNIIQALGVRFGLGEDSKEANLDKLRYHKVIIMADADVDGQHIATLVMTLFYRYMPQIIQDGYLYIAMPPLYRCKKGKIEEYCYNDRDKQLFIQKYGDGSEEGISTQRYKGLGEMSAEQLWETTMCPETRLLKQVTIENAAEADYVFSMLMGDDVGPRREFIEKNALHANIDA